MSGWESQEAGDWGESVVKSELSSRGITSAPLDPDLGEDFLVEVSGREASATGAHPRAALIQVKTFAKTWSGEEIKVPGIKKTKLMRWSAQQLPVFVVVVSGFSTKKPIFYVKSVDAFLDERFRGIEIKDIETDTVTVVAQRTDDIADTIISEIERYHSIVHTDLCRVSDVDKRNEHFEIVRRRHDLIGLIAKHVSWSVIWRSTRRPAYFSAMLGELLREARSTYSELDVPVYVSFHIYRSQYDLVHNLAVARIHWIDDSYPRFGNVVHGADHDNPRIEYIETHPGTRAFIDSKTTDVTGFIGHVKDFAPKLDAFAVRLLEAENHANKGREFWTDNTMAEIDELERIWEIAPIAPPELNVLQELLGSYVHALMCHRIFAGKAHWNLEAEKERYRLETAKEIQYYYGSWWVIMKNIGWDFPYYQ